MNLSALRRPTNALGHSKTKTQFSEAKCVALQSVTFRTKRDFNTHRLLRAIDKNVLLSQLKTSDTRTTRTPSFLSQEIEKNTYEFIPAPHRKCKTDY